MLDRLESIRNHFGMGNRNGDLTSYSVPGEPTVANARRRKAYLETLDPDTRGAVEQFLTFAQELQTQMDNITRIAVTAVGSSTRDQTRRYHSVNDIDLRILNDESTNSLRRKVAIDDIQNAVKGYLTTNEIPFYEGPNILSTKMVPSFRYNLETGKREGALIPFAEFYNDDPSFTTKVTKGIPLHISISGLDNYPLVEYLQWERVTKTTTVLLLPPQNN